MLQSPAEDIKKSASWTVLRNAYLLLQVQTQREEITVQTRREKSPRGREGGRQETK